MKYPTPRRGEQTGRGYDKVLGECRAGKVLGAVSLFRGASCWQRWERWGGQGRGERQNRSQSLVLSCPSPCGSRGQRRSDMVGGVMPRSHTEREAWCPREGPTMFQFEKAELCGRLRRHEGNGEEVARPLSRFAGWGLSVDV